MELIDVFQSYYYYSAMDLTRQMPPKNGPKLPFLLFWETQVTLICMERTRDNAQ